MTVLLVSALWRKSHSLGQFLRSSGRERGISVNGNLDAPNLLAYVGGIKALRDSLGVS